MGELSPPLLSDYSVAPSHVDISQQTCLVTAHGVRGSHLVTVVPCGMDRLVLRQISVHTDMLA